MLDINLDAYTQYCFGGIDQRDREIGELKLNVSSLWPQDPSPQYRVSGRFSDSEGVEIKIDYPFRVISTEELKTAEDWLMRFYSRHSK